jgi:hypothetical protein
MRTEAKFIRNAGKPIRQLRLVRNYQIPLLTLLG